MISIKNLQVSYGNKVILKNLDFKFEECGIWGIVGLNGSGKTTLLNTIYGLKKQDSGEILYKDRPLNKKDIAFLETKNYFYPRLKGKEYLRLFQLKNKSFDFEKWNELFKVPLNDIIDHYSSGEKKKLAFLAIIALNRSFIMLDEPFNSIDLESNQKIKLILEELRAHGKTILLTSHIMESLTSICDGIGFLNNGHIEMSFDKGNYDNIEDKIFNIQNMESRKIISQLIGE